MLHGYHDGHRLIASSTKLSLPSERTMLARSDLSGPLSDEPLCPYLCGYSLPDDFYYVISRTWLAPEMPRPGCVWTHSILIPVADLGVVQTVAPVLSAFRRPKGDFSSYREPLTLQDATNEQTADAGQLMKWLVALYAQPVGTIWAALPNPEALEPVILSLWEQQWPRLRRSLSFCSAYLGSPESGWADLVGIPKTFFSRWRKADPERFADVYSVSSDSPETWVSTAARDAATPGGTPFRQFLWRHGASEERPRELFVPLAETFVLATQTTSGERSANDLLKALRKHFPTSKRLPRLKLELLGPPDARADGPSAEAGEVELVTTLFKSGKQSSLPDLKLPERLPNAWTNASSTGRVELLSAVATSKSAEKDKALIHGLAEVVDASAILDLTARALPLALALIRHRPELCGDASLWERPAETQALINALISEEPSGFDPRPLIGGALRGGSEQIFDCLARAFPTETAGCVLKALAENEVTYWACFESARSSLDRHADLVARALQSAAEPSIGILQAATYLLDSADTGKRPAIWAPVLPSLEEVPPGDARLTVQAFILASALLHPSDRPDAERLAAATYCDVYEALSRLLRPSRGWHNLERSLPQVGFYREWDRCWRLKEAVAESFVESSWSPESLPAFATNREAFRKLVLAIGYSDPGRKLLHDASRAWPECAPSWGRKLLEAAVH